MKRRVVGASIVVTMGIGAPLVAGEAMGPEVVLSSLALDEMYAQVAFDETHDQYVVVWEAWDHVGTPAYSILARRFDRNGLPLGGAVVVGPGGDFHDRARPSIAYDPTADGFLIVYDYDYWGDGSDWDIRGRLFAWNLGAGSSELTLAASVDNEWFPRVAYSATSQVFLVAWARSSPGVVLRVDGALVADGTAGPPFIIASSPSEDRTVPQVAHDAIADSFLVATTNYHDIFATRVDASGALGPEVEVAAWPDDESSPDVASCGDGQFAVVWQSRVGGGDTDVYARFLHGDGTIATPPIVIDGSPDSEEQYPSVACLRDRDEFLIAYLRLTTTTSSLRGRRMSTSHMLRPGYELKPDTGATDSWDVAGGAAGWLAAWNSWDPTSLQFDIHARVTWSLFADDFEWGNASQWSSVVP